MTNMVKMAGVNRMLPSPDPHARSGVADVLTSFYDDKAEQFLRYLRQFGHVTYAANMTGATRRAFYARRERDPEFAEVWDEALQSFEDELTHRVVQTALEMGTGKWVAVLNEAGEQVLDDQFERVFEFKTGHVDPRVLTKLLSLRMSSADGAATTNVQVNNVTTVNPGPKPAPRLVMPEVFDDEDYGVAVEAAEVVQTHVSAGRGGDE